MVRRLLNTNMLIAITVVLVMSMSFSSCDPLRKKFTRQKKKGQVEDTGFIPVLEPEEYAAPNSDPAESYKDQYVMVKVWYKDLWSALDDKSPDKRVRSTLDQVYGHLEEMNKLVNEEKRAELARLKELLAYYDNAMNMPKHMRNVSRIQSDLRAFHRLLNSKLAPSKVKKDLVAVVAK